MVAVFWWNDDTRSHLHAQLYERGRGSRCRTSAEADGRASEAGMSRTEYIHVSADDALMYREHEAEQLTRTGWYYRELDKDEWRGPHPAERRPCLQPRRVPPIPSMQEGIRASGPARCAGDE